MSTVPWNVSRSVAYADPPFEREVVPEPLVTADVDWAMATLIVELDEVEVVRRGMVP